MARPQPVTVDFKEKSAIKSWDVKSPTCKGGWAGKPVEIGPGGRDHWDGDRIEHLIREKIMTRTKSGNGQVYEAFKLFNNDGDPSISPEEFRDKVGHLLNTTLTEGEIMSLFQKYDDDGSGEITIHEFVAGVFPNDFPIRSEMAEHCGGDFGQPPAVDECPPTRGYGGHVPGNTTIFGQALKTHSPHSSPCNSPTPGAHNLSPMEKSHPEDWNVQPTSPGGSMGAYPCHVVDPGPEPLLSPKWATK